MANPSNTPPTPEELKKWAENREKAKQAIFDAHAIIDDRYPPPPVGGSGVPVAVPMPISKRPWGDADDFYRETAGSDPLFLESSANDERYFIHNTVSGNVYQFTCAQVVNGGMGSFRMGELFTLNQVNIKNPTARSVTTHVMHKGSVLCKNVKGSPVTWPKGHEWVPLDVQTEKEVSNCLGCIEVWATLR